MLFPALLYAVAIPGALALAIALLGKRREPAVAAAVAVAAIAASWGIVGRPSLVPDDISQWLGHIAVVGLIGAVLAKRPWTARVVIAVVTGYLVIRPVLHRWGTGGELLVLGGGMLSLLIYATAIHRVLDQASPRVGTTIALISATASSVATAASGSLVIGEIGGGLATGVGVLWGITLLRPSRATNLAYVIAPVAWAVVVIGLLYAAMPLHVAVLALLPPIVACGGLLVPRRGAVVSIALAVLATAATVGLAAKPPPVVEEADYGYE